MKVSLICVLFALSFPVIASAQSTSCTCWWDDEDLLVQAPSDGSSGSSVATRDEPTASIVDTSPPGAALPWCSCVLFHTCTRMLVRFDAPTVVQDPVRTDPTRPEGVWTLRAMLEAHTLTLSRTLVPLQFKLLGIGYRPDLRSAGAEAGEAHVEFGAVDAQGKPLIVTFEFALPASDARAAEGWFRSWQALSGVAPGERANELLALLTARFVRTPLRTRTRDLETNAETVHIYIARTAPLGGLTTDLYPPGGVAATAPVQPSPVTVIDESSKQ
jgi:hypothetical protein